MLLPLKGIMDSYVPSIERNFQINELIDELAVFSFAMHREDVLPKYLFLKEEDEVMIMMNGYTLIISLLHCRIIKVMERLTIKRIVNENMDNYYKYNSIQCIHSFIGSNYLYVTKLFQGI